MKNNKVCFMDCTEMFKEIDRKKRAQRIEAIKDFLTDPELMFALFMCIPYFIAWVIVASAIIEYYLTK